MSSPVPPPSIEVLSVKITSPPITVCAVYILPNANSNYHLLLTSYLRSLVSVSKFIIILGDFNMIDINWNTLVGFSPTSSTFCDLTYNCNLYQLINSPTHKQGNILDLLFTNVPERITNIAIYNSCILHSDHSTISFSVASTSHVTHARASIHICNYNKDDLSRICSFLLDYNFKPCFLSDNVDFVWLYIKQVISQAVDLFVPTIYLCSNPHPKWFSSTIRHNINCLKSLRCSHSIDPTPSKQIKIFKLETSLNYDIQQAKSNYEASLIFNYS